MDKAVLFSCPNCHARHSTEAWTYKTRKELDLDNIDVEDIVHMNDIETLLKSENEFFCPSCHESTLAKVIYDFENKTMNEIKEKLTSILIHLQQGEEEIVLKGLQTEDNSSIQVSFEDGKWYVNTSSLVDNWDNFSNIDEAAEYLLKCKVSLFL
ncbi:hypothetical protein [Bacillus thuringiensis]|uniref:hypothetical protein n=1 Tax=Bacillus thuringiensis TaxID=1428 RepID=UPI0021D69A5B|nr:hypothetical protein [Bacillus thuringiensis]MCU7667363.1 hypothetical protein [Bacillus thuringiensis]